MKEFLVILFFLLFSYCSDQNDTELVKGDIIGYLKCIDAQQNNETLIGTFIITEKMDSLLSFDLPLSISGLDTSQVSLGVGFFNGGTIDFEFTVVNQDQIKTFDCPPENAMSPPSFLPIDHFKQIQIKSANKTN